MKRLLILALALTLVAGCESSDPLYFSVTGQWAGTIVVAGEDTPITANLLQDGMTIVGTGLIGSLTGLSINGDVSANGDITFSYRINDTAQPPGPPRFVFFQGGLANNARLDGLLVNLATSPMGVLLYKQ